MKHLIFKFIEEVTNERILFLIIRLLYRIPGWLLKIRSYNKHIDETTFEERFDFGQK
ncbi:MAG: hypothetical protein ACLSBH_09345 [Coprobacillus cateniformis]